MKQKIIIFLLVGFVFVFTTIKIAKFYHVNGYTQIVNSNSDSEGYYQYLPWTINENDVLHQPYSINLENGYLLNKYTCGVAFLEAPFFLTANVLAKPLGYDTSGYNELYGFFILLSASIYLYISFYVLFLILYKKYSGLLSIASILFLYFATSLFYYNIMEPGMSHVYSFFCFSMIIYYIEKYYEELKLKYVFSFGFFFALATLIRPTNILLILLFVFYETYTIKGVKEKLLFHLKRYYNFAIIFIIGLLMFLPQMLYWHAITGKFIFYSYVNETFSNWNSPKIVQVLAGHKSGWLLFAPIMGLSLIGLLMGWKKKVVNAPVITVIFLMILYICASWWAYTFGCGYGYRSFTEYQAILIFPFAYFLSEVSKSKYKLLKILNFSFCIFCVWYSIKLTSLYYNTGGCWDGPDWKWENQINMMKQVFIN